jgi:hypothetical protein
VDGEDFMKTKTKTPSDTGARPPKISSGYPWIFSGQNRRNLTRNAKVRISILIDLDVFEFLQERASKAGSLPISTDQSNIASHRVDAKNAGSR